jgi:hypothetical protein
MSIILMCRVAEAGSWHDLLLYCTGPSEKPGWVRLGAALTLARSGAEFSTQEVIMTKSRKYLPEGFFFQLCPVPLPPPTTLVTYTIRS